LIGFFVDDAPAALLPAMIHFISALRT